MNKWRLLSGFLLLVTCIGDRKTNLIEENECKTSSFCERNLGLSNRRGLTWILDPSSFKMTESYFLGYLSNNQDMSTHLSLNLSIGSEGFLGVKITDINESKWSRLSSLFTDPAYIDMVSAFKSRTAPKGYISTRNDTHCVIQFPVNSYQIPSYLYRVSKAKNIAQEFINIAVIYQPFRLQIYLDKRLLMLINNQNLLNYESYQESASIDDWNKTKYNTLGSPMSVGIDFTFKSSQLMFGLPDSSREKLDLKDGIYRLSSGGIPVTNSSINYGSIPYFQSISTHSNYESVLWLNEEESYVRLSHENQVDRRVQIFSKNGNLHFILIISNNHYHHQYKLLQIIGESYIPPLFALGLHEYSSSPKQKYNTTQIEEKLDELDFPLDAIWRNKEVININHKYSEKINKRRIIYKTDLILVESEIKYRRDINEDEMFVMGNIRGAEKGKMVNLFNEKSRDLWKIYLRNKRLMGEDLYLAISQNSSFIVSEGENGEGDQTAEEMNNTKIFYWRRAIKAIRDIVTDITPNKRSLLLFTEYFTGIGQYGGVIINMNESPKQPELKASMAHLVTLILNGQSISGYSIPAFPFNVNQTLIQNWYKSSILNPLLSIDSGNNGWRYEEKTLNSVRNSINTRYRFLPYIYTQVYIYRATGLPILRPLFFEYDMKQLLIVGNKWKSYLHNQFFIGEDLLLVPIYDMENYLQVHLPTSDIWYNYSDSRRIVGIIGDILRVEKPLQSLDPLIFIRGGGILPLKDRKRRSGDLMSRGPFSLLIAPDFQEFAQGVLYIDDYSSNEYKQGCYKLVRYQFLKGYLDGLTTIKSVILHNWQHSQVAKCTTSSDYEIETIKVLGIKQRPKRVTTYVGDKIRFVYSGKGEFIEIRKPNVNTKNNWEIKIIY